MNQQWNFKVAMVIKERETQGVPVLVLSGRLDMFARNGLKDVMEKYQEAQTRRVIVDMRGVSFIDSAGLGVLALMVKAFQDFKGNVIVVNPQDTVRNILENVNFSKLIPMFQTNEDYSTFSALS
ncbi:STAS domain-containing protein [Candidatus Nitronereus thalassa]|uniref:Anti-sigma factor antagonist n=1 Tax=Candidatus Nitronereus thalassa TaxID=3020898 RepID=A0ABU3K546_9BACT|nr:STAS domain-containing protein [Candidatus Nitronereus thalassa]MDT7041508.1 STAS domain-containing protein [Candidatus Nitronereus thalassa]